MAYLGTKPANAVLTSEQIADGAISTADIADSAVIAAKIANATITEAKLASGAINTQALSLFNASGSAPVYACRAWVNFNGTGTVAIRASGNVSSITDVNTGLYYVNLSNAMPDVNYSVTVGVQNNISNANSADNIGILSTSIIQWQHIEAAAATDTPFLCLAVFR